MRKVKMAWYYYLIIFLLTILTLGSFLERIVKDHSTLASWRNICQISYLLLLPTLLIVALEWYRRFSIAPERLKSLSEELSMQKKQLECIVENMSDICVVVDKAGKYIVVNKAGRDLFSSIEITQAGDYLKGARYYDIEGNEINTCSTPAVRVIEGEKLINYRLILRNEEREIHFDVNGTPVYDDKGEFQFGVICSHDVTALVQNEEKLSLQNEQLKTIINTMSDMATLSIADKDGNLLYYSNSANSYFFKDTYKAKLGSTYRKGVFFHIDGSEMDYSELTGIKVLKGEKVSNSHFIMKDCDEEKHFLSNGAPVYDKDGNLTYGVFFTLDITEQVLHKRLVSITEKLAALNAFKDKLITVVTHDIRNPIATLMSMMELLEGDKEQSGEYQEILSAVGEQLKYTYSMVENLLNWFRNQSDSLVYSPKILNLNKIAGETLNLFYNNARAKVVHIINAIEKSITVVADKDMLDLVLRNLIDNAIKFTDLGGTICLNAVSSGKKVIFSISDTGVGIEPEKVKTLFSENFIITTLGTTGEKGNGLGLLICLEFVQRNGGEIWVESEPEKGSTFYFSLPSDGTL